MAKELMVESKGEQFSSLLRERNMKKTYNTIFEDEDDEKDQNFKNGEEAQEDD